MKTLGDKVREFRESRGWTTTEMARQLRESRQKIEQLEAAGDRLPKYVVKLADLMEVSLDDLLNRDPRKIRRADSAEVVALPPQPVRAWPFAANDYERLMRLDRRWHGVVELAVHKAIGECEAMAANADAA